MESLNTMLTTMSLIHTIFESVPQIFIQTGVIMVFGGRCALDIVIKFEP